MDLAERIEHFEKRGATFKLTATGILRVGVPDDRHDLLDDIDSYRDEIERHFRGETNAPIGNGKSTPHQSIVQRVGDVESTQVDWLWPGRIAKGKVTLIGGDPGLGKSFCSLDIASRVTRGFAWPDDQDTTAPKGSVVMLTAEDDIADTVRPRIEALSGDPESIYAIQGVSSIDSEGRYEREFDLNRDIDCLAQTVTDIQDCRLVIIDPISAYIGKIDAYRDNEVRSTIKPLSDLAAKYGVAVIGITHLNKGSGKSIYRLMGSLAFAASARSAYAIVRDKHNRDLRLFLPVKNNIGPDQLGLSFTLIFNPGEAGYIEWQDGTVDVSADEALDDSISREEHSARDEAVDWLREKLANGRVPAKEIKAAAQQDGIALRTLDRAKSDLGVKAGRAGFQGPWFWHLPGQRAVELVPVEPSQ